MTAKEAARALGVSLPTLYAYVSRGQLHSEPMPGNPRERRYHREDIERLKDRKEVRRDPSRVAERGLHWGSPVLASGITLIHEGRLYYRGRDAVELSRSATLEEVAELLWEGPISGQANRLPHPKVVAKDPIVRMQAAVALEGASDPMASDLRPASVRTMGARILRLVRAIASGRRGSGLVHETLWNRGAGDAIRTALVLCADHELNVSAFTARCVASAGASVYDAVAAALAAVKGLRHGGEAHRVARLFAEVGEPRRARSAIAARVRSGERLSGFGHQLYASGDPRGARLMELAEDGPDREAWKLARAIAKAGWETSGEWPNVDFALVAMCRAYRLPADAPRVLFAVGRTVGWVAHAMEQYASGELIRPRAKYTGNLPEEDARRRVTLT